MTPTLTQAIDHLMVTCALLGRKHERLERQVPGETPRLVAFVEAQRDKDRAALEAAIEEYGRQQREAGKKESDDYWNP